MLPFSHWLVAGEIFSPADIALILAIALLVFGPGKLPEIGRSLGKTIREFKAETNKITNEVNESLKVDSQPTAKTEDKK
ncbi:twin-arginine translocase TatA/TatE family subunit [Moorella naiadis]|uniref:Sec-independent protein translocase subunit TatA/TatB n=1 Tax=Moorella naiadis (nom. illeg.) TaxID=3093670 RepID=UPI003D9CA7C7